MNIKLLQCFVMSLLFAIYIDASDSGSESSLELNIDNIQLRNQDKSNYRSKVDSYLNIDMPYITPQEAENFKNESIIKDLRRISVHNAVIPQVQNESTSAKLAYIQQQRENESKKLDYEKETASAKLSFDKKRLEFLEKVRLEALEKDRLEIFRKHLAELQKTQLEPEKTSFFRSCIGCYGNRSDVYDPADNK